MPEPTYENVAPLVQSFDMRGRTVDVVFCCPASGETAPARFSLPKGQGVGTQISTSMKRSLLWGLRSTVASVIRSVFGYNLVGRVAGDAAYAVLNDVTRNQSPTNLSSNEQKIAMVEAFRTVLTRFVWDPNRGSWVSASAARELMSDFERQLAEHPITHGYDRQILARMLVQIAQADGRLSSEESTWLTECITPDLGAVADLARRPPISGAELRSTSQGPVRESMLMMAWAMAVIDEELAQPEYDLLNGYAQGFGLNDRQLQHVRASSQGWVIDQALERMFTWGGHDAHAREQLYALAGRLGMTQEEAQEAEARFQRRTA